jgi:hypothetical protein
MIIKNNQTLSSAKISIANGVNKLDSLTPQELEQISSVNSKQLKNRQSADKVLIKYRFKAFKMATR